VYLIFLPFFLVIVFFQYQIVKQPERRKRAGKAPEEGDEGGDAAKRFNKTVRCSLKEVKTCAKMLKLRHMKRFIKAGFGCVFDLTVDSNISRPLMGNIYMRIGPTTMILGMGEVNKVLRITSDAITIFLDSLKVIVPLQGPRMMGLMMLS